MAMVLSTVTLSTVKIRLRSECSFFGSTAAMAMAAEAPQMATEPPVNSARRQPRPSRREPSEAEEDGGDHPEHDQCDQLRPEADQQLDADPRAEQGDAAAQHGLGGELDALRRSALPRQGSERRCREAAPSAWPGAP